MCPCGSAQGQLNAAVFVLCGCLVSHKGLVISFGNHINLCPLCMEKQRGKGRVKSEF